MGEGLKVKLKAGKKHDETAPNTWTKSCIGGYDNRTLGKWDYRGINKDVPEYWTEKYKQFEKAAQCQGKDCKVKIPEAGALHKRDAYTREGLYKTEQCIAENMKAAG